MQFRFFSLLIGVLVCYPVFSQRKIVVDKLLMTNPIAIKMPFMVDSTNLKGNKFDKKSLLETWVRLPAFSSFTEEVKTDLVSDYFFMPKARDEAQFRFLNFQMSNDRYCKATLKITSPGMFELYANGKKELIKSTIEDSLHLAKVQNKALTLSPGTTTDIVIKYLSFPENIAKEGVKISVELPKKDSLVNLVISQNGKRFVNLEDIVKGTRVTGTSISPNGRFVILTYRNVNNLGKTSFTYELYDVKTGIKRQMGNAKIAWLPTTNKFYYTSNVLNNRQIITVDPETFIETVLCENISASRFYFTPDEKSILFTETEKGALNNKNLKLLRSPEERLGGYDNRSFIYKQDLSTGIKQRLTFGKQSTYMSDISLDSRYLLYYVNKETLTESPFSKTSMFRLDMQTMTVDTLWVDDANSFSAKFSPDGTKVLVFGTPLSFNGIGLNIPSGELPNNYDTQVFIMDLKTKKVEAITKNFDPSVKNANWNVVDNQIYLTVVDKDCENVYTYNLKNKSFSKLNLSEEVTRNFSLANASLTASYSGMSHSNPARAYFIDLKTLKSHLISDPLKLMTESLQLGEVKDWNFTASDGTEITGRYYLPPNFDASKKYPLIVYYYGGTTPVPRTFDYPYPMHVYASLGYVVYVLQPSGAIGFGQEFSARHVNAWGKRTADDIIEGTKKFVNDHSFVNSKKIGCIGASYGGFMTMYLQTQTDIFSAAVSHAGISSIASYWGEGYWGYSYSSRASTNSYPWNNKEMYIEQSPLFNADKIHTPLLLLHGTEDTNVPMGESIQMYTALKILGREVEFIQVKGENHGISDFKKRTEWNNSIYAWFDKWLYDDSAWWNSMYEIK